MKPHQLNSVEPLWQLSDFDAHLQAALLEAHIDLSSPSSGLKRITWNSSPLIGSVLGIDLSREHNGKSFSDTSAIERYTRGSDLVARYPENQSQPYSLEAYWRVSVPQTDHVQIDSIVSLQTSLLESYPTAQTVTSLAAHEAWFVPSDGTKARMLANELNAEQTTTSDDFAGILLRSKEGGWSYLEGTQVSDLGTWQADWDKSGKWTMKRFLGGEFQEKGVIRRLRVRGIFLPQEGDIENAPHLLSEFASSPPPLTV